MGENQRPWDNQPGPELEKEAAQFRNRVTELLGEDSPLLKYVNGNTIEGLQEAKQVYLEQQKTQELDQETKERRAYQSILNSFENALKDAGEKEE